MQQRAPLFAIRLGTRLIVTCLGIVLILGITEHAWAFDCLAYKPESAQGQWHADVVSGKICWYGPKWRSFLPKPKAGVENSQVTNSKPKKKVVNRKPDTQVVKGQIENGKRDVQIENAKPDSPVGKVENGKLDVQTENSKSEMPPLPTSPLAKAVDSDRAQDSTGVRKATPVEAAEFTNAASLKFEPEPAAHPDPPEMTSEPQSITDLLLAFSIVALGTIGFAALILRGGSQQDTFDADLEEQPLEHMHVDDELAPSLQPNADDEHVPLENPPPKNCELLSIRFP
jgi:hypothetical protein